MREIVTYLCVAWDYSKQHSFWWDEMASLHLQLNGVNSFAPNRRPSGSNEGVACV